jgi:hypothetical protein
MANYTKPHSFNIVLNSQQVSTASSGNPNDCTYEFNWTNIPQGKYVMSFSYKGKNNGDFVSNDSPQLFLSLNSVSSTYQASNAYGSVVSTYIGGLHAETHAANQVSFYANETDNCNVYFDSLPTSGPIRLQVFRDDFTTPFTTITGGLDLANYVVVLHFKQIGKLDGYNI